MDGSSKHTLPVKVVTRIEPGQEDQRGIQGILNGAGLGFRYSGLIDARFNFVSGFLHRLLCEVDLGYRTELVLTILRELATNCSKAHAKRIYFQSQRLDISIPADYASGMASFRADVLSHWDQFVAANSTNEFYIELSFELNADAIVIHMENNVELLPSEWERITQRRQKAAQIRDILEAFNAFDDDNEGAGLGIVFISLLLRNAGIAESNLIIDSRRGVTRHTLIVPRLPAQLRSGIRDEMLREIEGLPSLPDRVNQLVVLCNDSSASIASIAQEIERDPAMAAQILRLVHSAGFMTRRRNMDVESAVKVIGLQEVSELVVATASRSVLANHFQIKEMETIWDASNRVSFFAAELSERCHVKRSDAAIAGLLLELGKIVMIGLKQDTMERIEEMLGSKRVRTSSILEESTLGISHPEIGARLGEKWNFPQAVIDCIRYQHKPLLCVSPNEALVRAVSLASRLHASTQGMADYYAVDPEVLHAGRVHSPEEFAKLAKFLEEQFKKQIA